MENNGMINPVSVTSEIQSRIDKDIVKNVLNSNFEDNKTKIGQDAQTAVAEIINCLCTETCLRAVKQSLRDSSEKVDLEHLEKCLPQLMLDFP